jgi:K(+)-stimulated pyrophosphate-energized sodium pump
MSIVALVIAPHISEGPNGSAETVSEKIEITRNIEIVDGKEVITETKTITRN